MEKFLRKFEKVGNFIENYNQSRLSWRKQNISVASLYGHLVTSLQQLLLKIVKVKIEHSIWNIVGY